MSRILVTGAGGFIGQHAVARLVARGWDVHGVGKAEATGGFGGAVWHSVDLFDEAAVVRLMDQIRPSHMLNFAWCTEPRKYWRSLDNFRWLQASLSLIECFRSSGGRRVVLAGTCAEYDWGHGYCNEKMTPTSPTTPYGISKNSLRQLVESYCGETELGWAWGRIFFLYGPGERCERLVPSVINSLLRNEPALCTSGTHVRDFLYVADVAAAFVTMIESEESGCFNVGSGEPISLADIVTLIGRKLERQHFVRLGARPTPLDEPPLLLADSQSLRSLGWAPEYSLSSGLDASIEWWRARLQS